MAAAQKVDGTDLRTHVELSVTGVFTDVGYQRCVAVARALAENFVTVTCTASGLTETDWEDFVLKKARELGSEAYDHRDSPLVLYNGCNYVGGTQAFFAWAQRIYDAEIDSTWLHQALMGTTPSSDAFEKHPDADPRHSFVEMELTYGEGKEQQVGKVRIELYEELCPKACANFKALCSGTNDQGLSYVGSPFHRVVTGGYVQGGDIVDGHGDAGKSVFGDTFADECFSLSHGATGIVSMSNQGPHTNASQFFVTLKPLPFLDTKFSAIGRVVSGMRHFRGIEKMPQANQRPIGTCIVSGAAVLAEANGASDSSSKTESKSE